MEYRAELVKRLGEKCASALLDNCAPEKVAANRVLLASAEVRTSTWVSFCSWVTAAFGVFYGWLLSNLQVFQKLDNGELASALNLYLVSFGLLVVLRVIKSHTEALQKLSERTSSIGEEVAKSVDSFNFEVFADSVTNGHPFGTKWTVKNESEEFWKGEHCAGGKRRVRLSYICMVLALLLCTLLLLSAKFAVTSLLAP